MDPDPEDNLFYETANPLIIQGNPIFTNYLCTIPLDETMYVHLTKNV